MAFAEDMVEGGCMQENVVLTNDLHRHVKTTSAFKNVSENHLDRDLTQHVRTMELEQVIFRWWAI